VWPSDGPALTSRRVKLFCDGEITWRRRDQIVYYIYLELYTPRYHHTVATWLVTHVALGVGGG
jgi:hypothetical protein